MNTPPLHRTLDHAVLKPQLTRDEIDAALRLGLEHRVRTVCVHPCDVPRARELCAGSETDVCAVVDFPHGCSLDAAKAAEARACIEAGAAEVDMVANYGWIRSGLWDRVEAQIRLVAELARTHGALLKVIFETAELDDLQQVRRATVAAADAGADFVKTSTGFANGGASVEAVGAMLDAAGGRVAVKASGGIRTREQAMRYLQMGCSRLGVGYSTTPVLLEGAPADSEEAY
jgi:deoxyribose-phosphate aldolase